jgi:hypothetical protein
VHQLTDAQGVLAALPELEALDVDRGMHDDRVPAPEAGDARAGHLRVGHELVDLEGRPPIEGAVTAQDHRQPGAQRRGNLEQRS